MRKRSDPGANAQTEYAALTNADRPVFHACMTDESAAQTHTVYRHRSSSPIITKVYLYPLCPNALPGPPWLPPMHT